MADLMTPRRAGIGRRWLQLPLPAKLAWLSGGLTAIIVLATFVGLSLRAGEIARSVVSGEVERNQATLVQLEKARLADLLVGGTLVASAPDIHAVLATEGSEQTQGRLTPSSRRRYG